MCALVVELVVEFGVLHLRVPPGGPGTGRGRRILVGGRPHLGFGGGLGGGEPAAAGSFVFGRNQLLADVVLPRCCPLLVCGAPIVPAAAFFGVFFFAYFIRRSGAPTRYGILTAVGQLLAWAAFAALWFNHHLLLGAAFALLAVFGFCYQACFGLGLNKIEHAPGIGADTVGVAAGFYFTGVSIGGYVLPTILARIVDAAGEQAGFIGLGGPLPRRHLALDRRATAPPRPHSTISTGRAFRTTSPPNHSNGSGNQHGRAELERCSALSGTLSERASDFAQASGTSGWR